MSDRNKLDPPRLQRGVDGLSFVTISHDPHYPKDHSSIPLMVCRL